MKNNLSDIHWFGFLKSVPRDKFILTIFYGVARIIISAAWPYVLYHYLQKKNVGNSLTEVVAVILTVIVMFILSGIASHRQSMINIIIMKAFSLSLVDKIWKKMISLDWLTFHGKSRVYFFDMLMVEAWRLRIGLMALLELIIVNSVIAAALTFFIAFISWQLFVLFVISLLATVVLHYNSIIKIRPYFKRFHSAWRDQHQWIAKSVDQFDLIKMGRAYDESAEAHYKNTLSFLTTNSAMLHNQSKWRTINQVAGNMIRVIIFLTGIYWVQVNDIRLVDLFIVLLIVSIIQNNLAQMPGAISNFIEGQESAASISTFFSLPEEVLPDGPALADDAAINSISVKGLTFHYCESPAVSDMDISFEKGKIYLWKGANGSGKSTVAHILLGLLAPQAGSLAINGYEVKWDSLKTLRKRFAFLNQDAPIFMGTVKENILFGHPESENTWNWMHNTWLAALLPTGEKPDDRKVGERGEGISGGEGRRLALIREWLRKSEMIILDEPLNHLDDFTINEIKREIVNIKNNAIVIIISHQAGFENIADEIKQF